MKIGLKLGVLFVAFLGFDAVVAVPSPTLAANTKKVSLMRPARLQQNQKTTFDIVLKTRNADQEYQNALAVNTPGTKTFKQFLSPTEFRSSYGQPVSVTHRWQQFLNQHHLKATTFSNGLIIQVSGKVNAIEKAFRVNLKHATYHQNVLQFGSHAPKIPNSLKKSVRVVIGMTDHNQNNVFAKSQFGLSRGQNVSFGKETVSGKFGYTNQFTDHYGVNQLYQRGLTGKGQTVGIIAFEGFQKSDIFKFWKHEKADTNPHRLSVKNVSGDLYSPKLVNTNDSIETAMDVEYAGSVAPQANIKVFRIANGIPNLMNLINAYSTVFDANQVSTVSTSWGIGSFLGYRYLQRQGIVAPNYQEILNTVLAQGALEGISTFTGSGDQGAQAAYLKGVSHNKGIVSYSLNNGDALATNPWLMSIGGTTLPITRTITVKGVGTVTVKNAGERAWGDDTLLSSLTKNSNLLKMIEADDAYRVGSGGGFSKLYQTPSYQSGVAGVNTFNARPYIGSNGKLNLNPPLISGTGSGRNYPDLSVNADSLTGYYVYQKSFSKSGWVPIGGTSIASPQVAAVVALINGSRTHDRMGFWNPQIYQLAQRTDSPFTPLNSTTDNSNMYYTGQPNTIYNQASGLGIPNFKKLYDTYQ